MYSLSENGPATRARDTAPAHTAATGVALSSFPFSFSFGRAQGWKQRVLFRNFILRI